VRVNSATWVWSDTHFGHHNIIKFQARPATHEIIMLSNWCRLVDGEDTLLHLGDLHLRSNWNRWEPLLARMPGRKVLVLGNHDGHGVSKYERAGFTVVDPFVASVGKTRVAFTHRPLSSSYRGQPEYLAVRGEEGVWWPDVSELPEWDVNIHGHIHLNNHRDDDGVLSGRHINVSVEAIDFRPYQLGALL